jgi:hypothetical protein
MTVPRKSLCASAPTVTVVLWFVAATAVLCAQAAPAVAADARLRWLPSPEADVQGYRVYVRETGSPYGTGVDVGTPPTGSDGALAYVLSGLDPAIRYHVAVSAYASGQLESNLSNELPFGAPSSGTCGATDPVMDVHRLRVSRLPGRLKIAAKARFAESGFFDPTVAGLSMMVSDEMGEPLAQVAVAPSDVIPNGDGSVLKTRQKRGTGVPIELQRLSLRTRDGDTYLSVRIAVRPDTSLPSSAQLSLESGQLCVASQVLDCDSNARRLSCR